MKIVIILATAAAVATPALAQTNWSIGHRQPACMEANTCPTLSGTVHRQLGGAPAMASVATGGPFEPAPVTATMSAAPTGNFPARTTGDYPPCDPGPGDDRCIQLYERGVGHN